MLCPSRRRLALFSTALLCLGCLASAAGAQQVKQSSYYRDASRSVVQELTGGTPALRAQLANGRSAITVAVGDFDRDGTVDLVTGYAVGAGGALTLQRGNPAATAPTGADWVAYTQGNLPVPFFPAAQTFALPVRPDLLKVADMNGDGALDVLVAQRGDSNAYLLLGNGKGGFLAPRVLALGGAVSDLTTWRALDASSYVVAGVTSATGYSLNVVAGDGTLKSSFALPAAPTAVSHGQYNGGWADDLAVVAGGKVLLFDGPDAQLGKASAETLPIADATAAVAGSFVYDRRGYMQMAVLDADGSLHVLARAGLDSSLPDQTQGMARLHARTEAILAAHREGRPEPAMVTMPSARGQSWSEVETLSHIAPPATAQTAPILLRGRLSGGGGDDLAVVSAGAYVTVAHPRVANAVQKLTKPVVTVDSTSNPVTSVALARLSPDSRLSTITADGRATPAITVPTTFHNTYTVNSTIDGAAQSTCGTTCNLRTAVSLVNKDSGASLTVPDKIIINAGTYSFNTVIYNPPNDVDGDKAFYYPVDNSVDIVGAGCTDNAAGQPTSCTTILNGANQDLIFFLDYSTWSPNQGQEGSVSPGDYDIFLSGMELENGLNNNNFYADSGNENNFGGAISWYANTAGYLTITQCLFSDNEAKYGPGGAMAVGSYNGGNNTLGLEVDNSTFTGNSTPGSGGAIYNIGADVTALLNTDLFTSNLAETSVNPSTGADLGQGGALELPDGHQSTADSPAYFQILNSTFTSNAATDQAGAGYIGGGFTISGSTFSGNSTVSGTSSEYGGAIAAFPAVTGSAITDSDFTTNSAGDSGNAGAIYLTSNLSSSTTALSVQYSRFHGNIAGTDNAIEILGAGGNAGILSATDDWWGCNPTTFTTSIAGTKCDTAGATGSGASFSGAPYTSLTLSLSSTTPTGGASFSATGSTAQNSSSTVYSGNEDNALSGVAATLVITQPDTTATTDSDMLSASDTITESVTPDTTQVDDGSGSASVTVDGFTVTSAFTLDEADPKVVSTHTGNFYAGSTGNIYTLTVSNVGNISTSGTVTVVDTLPSGFTATAMVGTGWTCNVGTLTCTRSDALAASSSYLAISLTVTVSGSDVGSYSNSVTVSGGSDIDTSNDTSTDSTLVVGAPTITEAFSPTNIAVNGTSTVTFTIGNPSTNPVALTGVAFTDSLPTNLIVATPNGSSTTCNLGGVTATAGSGSIALSGATVAINSTCTVTVNVTSSTHGAYTNTTGAITATNGPTGPTASATLNVSTAPVLGEAFTVGTIATGGTSPLTITITSATGNPVTFTGLAFTDTLPTNLVVATPNGASTNCTSGTVVATAGGTSISFSSGQVAPGAICEVTVNVTGSTPGFYANPTSTLTDTQGITGGATTGELVVVSPPTLTESFSPTGISPGGTSTVSFTLFNPSGNPISLTGLAFSDTLPTGLVVATPSGESGACGGGTITATAGSGSITLTGATLAAAANCTFTVNVTSAAAGSYVNPTSTITDTQSISGTAATATLTVGDTIWILNGNMQLERLSESGAQLNQTSITATASTLGSIAFDNIGDAWVVGNADGDVYKYSATAASLSTGFSGGGVNTPTGIAIDGLGNAWIANGNNTVSEIANAVTAISPSTGYQSGTGTLNSPTGILVDDAGSVWVTNSGGNTVTKIIGVAAPAVTPTVTGVTNNTLGTRP